ncbi:hypothetical protein GOBAR_DD12483 [Gossypium barbadense]|nr:hypothetical protein GOBAR_DD12483 [Gossypium barbadense]
MSVIGEAALSGFLDLLVGKSLDSALNFVADHYQLHQQLKQWQSILPDIQAVLDDAEEKQIKNMGVKKWLEDLQDLAYDVDDILDEFAYEELRLNLQDTQAQARPSKIRKFIPERIIRSIFPPTSFQFNNSMITKVKDITDTLNSLTTRRSSLGLSEILSQAATSKGKQPRLQPTSVLDGVVEYVGRHKEKTEMIELLKGNNSNGVSVLSIVGMGGMGKTTLAQLVYNNATINESFDLKAWVCVSDNFDAIAITKAILQSITSESCDYSNLDLLQVKLKEKLSGKRFLLVLDDIWNENYNDWTILRSPFGPGTTIIVTTRLQIVSSIVDPLKVFHLDKLSDDDCLSIFTQHALKARNFDGHPQFKEIGEKIIRRCNGLPLAAKAIGSLLRTVKYHREWERINESEIWNLPEEQCGIIPALRLSYHHLPSYLKRCFAYCSILPKDYEFEEEEIILLWRAEGLLQQKAMPQVKDIGNQYFQDLVSRSFFQTSSKDESRFVMHDFINDLAQVVAGDICSKQEGDMQQKLSNRTRHSSYIAGEYDTVKKFEAFDQVKSLHGVGSFKGYLQRWEILSTYIISTSEVNCPQLVSLAAEQERLQLDKIPGVESLFIRDCERLNRLPEALHAFPFITRITLADCPGLVCFAESNFPPALKELRIVNCVNLQYLVDEKENTNKSMSSNTCLLERLDISCCPSLIWLSSRDDICNRLQHLKIRCCSKLSSLFLNAKLPVMLKQLFIGDCPMLECIAQDFLETTDLESIVIHDAEKIKSLPRGLDKLSHLQEIRLFSCPNLVSLEESGLPTTNLRALSIGGCENFRALTKCINNFTSFRELAVSNCSADISFPEEGFPTNLTSLQISNAPKIYTSLVEWGFYRLTSLQKLNISGEGCSRVVSFPEEAIGMMLPPSLTDISIRRFENLEFMCSKGLQHLTSLQQLGIYDCPKLASLPEKDMLLSLERLSIQRCPLLEEGCSRAKSGIDFSTLKPQALKAKLAKNSELQLICFSLFDLVKRDPWILTRSVDDRIAPSISDLKTVLGSNDDVVKLLKTSAWFLKSDLQKTMMPNIEFLRNCGICSSQIVSYVFSFPRFFLLKPESIKQFVERADALGFDRKSNMFLAAIRMLSSMSEENWELKLKLLGNWVSLKMISCLLWALNCKAESDENAKSNVHLFKALPLNKKILQAPSLPLPKKSLPQRPEFQVYFVSLLQLFHLRTSERARQHASNHAMKVPSYVSTSRNENTGLRSFKSINSLKEEKHEAVNKFKACALNKKAISSKGENGVLQNMNQTTATMKLPDEAPNFNFLC